jgi:crotonobetainyl-CoA:carnitine CoA-transferase CaiB-like acyl-CoA transferase
VLVTLTSGQWSGLVAAFGDDDPGAASAAAAGELTDTARRMGEGAAIMRAVRRRIADLPTAEVVHRLTEADVPCAPVVALDELHREPQVVASGSLVEVDHPVMGVIRQPAPAARFDGRAAPVGAPAPAVGAHGREILRDLGCDDAEIGRLAADGVVVLA